MYKLLKKSKYRSNIVPRSFVAPFFVILKPGDVGVEGAVLIPLLCPMFERDDRLFAEGDNVPLIFPKMKMNFDSDLVQRCSMARMLPFY